MKSLSLKNFVNMAWLPSRRHIHTQQNHDCLCSRGTCRFESRYRWGLFGCEMSLASFFRTAPIQQALTHRLLHPFELPLLRYTLLLEASVANSNRCFPIRRVPYSRHLRLLLANALDDKLLLLFVRPFVFNPLSCFYICRHFVGSFAAFLRVQPCRQFFVGQRLRRFPVQTLRSGALQHRNHGLSGDC